MLLVARRWATKARTQAANQIHSVLVQAPEQVKHQLKGLNLKARVAVCARWRPGQAQTTTAYAKKVLRHLARRYQTLDAEIAELEGDIRRLCARANPALLAANGVGPDAASVLVVAAGDNPGRMASERSFAALCGASPVQASSGQTRRHRLNRGGNRHANSALWPMRYHPDAYRRCHQRICDQTPGGRWSSPRVLDTWFMRPCDGSSCLEWSSPRVLDTWFMRPCDGSSCPPIRLVAVVRSWSGADVGCTRLRSTIGSIGGRGGGCGSCFG